MSRRLVVPMGRRPWPAREPVVLALRALMEPEGRARMGELRLVAEDFPEGEPRKIATVLMEARPFTPAEDTALSRDDGRRMPWGVALSIPESMSGTWARSAIDKFAKAFAAAWFARECQDAAARVRAGVAPEVAARSIRDVLQWLEVA